MSASQSALVSSPPIPPDAVPDGSLNSNSNAASSAQMQSTALPPQSRPGDTEASPSSPQTTTGAAAQPPASSIPINTPPTVTPPTTTAAAPTGSTSSTSTVGPTPASVHSSASTSSANVTSPPVVDQQSFRSVLYAWRYEIVAVATSMAWLVVLVGTLFAIKGDPLPGWSLNSVISVYSVLLKACLLYVAGSAIGQRQWVWFQKERPFYDVTRFDDAREVLGSLRWLFWKPWADLLTSLGAAILVAGLFVDPFIQQLVQYDDCSIDMPERATVPRTNSFNPNMNRDLIFSQTPLPEAMTAFNSGLFSTVLDLTFGCSTGNCTYDAPSSTVGVCADCRDASDEVKVDCTNSSAPVFTYDELKLDQFQDDPQFSRIQFFQMFADFNQAFLTQFLGIFVQSSSLFTTELKMLSGSSACQAEVVDRNSGLPMRDCIENAKSQNAWKCRGYGAATCRIGPCVKTYNASVETGRYQETLIVETKPFENWGYSRPDFSDHPDSMTAPFPLATINTSCITADEAAQLSDRGYTIDAAEPWVAFNLTYEDNLSLAAPTSNASFLGTTVNRGCVYLINYQFVEGFLFNYITKTFADRVDGSLSENGSVTAYNGSQVLQHLYNFGYNDIDWISGILRNGSTAITNYIRQHGEPAFSIHAEGVMHHFATCIRIQWAWVALPAALIALTVLLLTLSMWSSRRQNLPVWKSSPLAYLLRGHVAGTGSPALTAISNSTPVSHDGLEDMSKTILAKLQMSTNSFALVRTGALAPAGPNVLQRLHRKLQRSP